MARVVYQLFSCEDLIVADVEMWIASEIVDVVITEVGRFQSRRSGQHTDASSGAERQRLDVLAAT